MEHRIAIQFTQIAWTKWARGAPAGTIRNALPREAPFRAPSDSPRGWLHRIEYNALKSSDYQHREEWIDLATGDNWRMPVKTRLDGDHLWIMPRVYLQKPVRANLQSWMVRLPFGQRAIIRINTAVDGDHQRHYYEYHLTVGFADTATLDLPLFRELDERVPLY